MNSKTYFVRQWRKSPAVYRLTEGAFIFEVGSAVSRRNRKRLAARLRAFAKE